MTIQILSHKFFDYSKYIKGLSPRTKSAIVTVDPFDALKIASLGLPQVTSLLANSMTEEQEEQLKKFRYILLLHKEPLNIVNRLCQTSFIQAPTLTKALKDLTDQELFKIIKPYKK